MSILRIHPNLIDPLSGSDGDVLRYSAANGVIQLSSIPISLSGIDVQVTNANLVPSANNMYSLGSPDRVWKDLYLSGNSLVIGNTVISESTGGGITISAEGGTTSLSPETGNVSAAIDTALAKAQEAIELSIIFS